MCPINISVDGAKLKDLKWLMNTLEEQRTKCRQRGEPTVVELDKLNADKTHVLEEIDWLKKNVLFSKSTSPHIVEIC